MAHLIEWMRECFCIAFTELCERGAFAVDNNIYGFEFMFFFLLCRLWFLIRGFIFSNGKLLGWIKIHRLLLHAVYSTNNSDKSLNYVWEMNGIVLFCEHSKLCSRCDCVWVCVSLAHSRTSKMCMKTFYTL